MTMLAQRRPEVVGAFIRHSRTDASPASESRQPYRRVIGPTIAPRKPSSHEEAELVGRAPEAMHALNDTCENFRVSDRYGQQVIQRIVVPVHLRQREHGHSGVILRAMAGMAHEAHRPRC